MRYACFLRAINVGGRNKIAMSDLANLFSSLGFTGVRTLLASGNVLFDAAAPSADEIEAALEARFGNRIAVTLRDVSQLEAVVRNLPFEPGETPEPERLLVAFFVRPLTRAPRLHLGPERLEVGPSEAYVYYPIGVGRSKLNLERVVGTTLTARNWNTVTRLLEMAQELSR